MDRTADTVTFATLPLEYQSAYLSQVDNDDLFLHNLRYDPSTHTLEAMLDVKKPFVQDAPENTKALGSFGRFHLSGYSAQVAIGQLAIAFGCMHTGKTKAELGEMIQRSFNITHRRAITTPTDIPLYLQLKNSRELKNEPPGLYAHFTYDIGNGDATGALTGLLPLVNFE